MHRSAGVKLTFRPGEGTSVRGVFQGQAFRLPFAEGSLGVSAGKEGNHANAATFEAMADYIGFDVLRTRLSLQVSALSEPEPSRFLSGVSTDQLRSGTRARIEYEPFRDWNAHRLVLFAEAEQAEVKLTVGGSSNSSTVHSLRAGAHWRLAKFGTLWPVAFSLLPTVAHGSVEGGQSYTKAGVAGTLQQRFAGLIQESSLRFESASAHTPVNELPSIGGAESVRGFRRDDGIGRQAWKLQSELWMPLRKTEGEGRLAEFLGSLWLAGFLDAGGTRKPAAGSAQGTRFGAGLGLRYVQPPLVVKLDLAKGKGPADTGRRASRVYFNFGTEFPL